MVLYGEQGALTSVASSASPVCSPYRHEETVGRPRAQRAEEMELQFEFELWFEFRLGLGSVWRAGGADERSEFSVPRLLAIQA